MSGSAPDTAAEAPSGERFVPGVMDGHLIEAEHLVRYAWAAQFAQGRRVLDAACGEGYGSKMMIAEGASEVVGVDNADEVIAKLRDEALDRARFEVGDVSGLLFGDDEFDLIVCFETIEHVAEPGQALDELARVLAPGGLLLVSTPNRDVYLPGNPFHLRELTPNELGEELSRRFGSVALRRQQTWVASGVLDDERFALGEHRPLEGTGVRKAQGNRPEEETYTIGMASDGELPLGSPLVSLTDDIDIRDWSARLHSAELETHAERDLLRAELDQLRSQLAESETELSRLAELETKLDETRTALDAYEDLSARHEEMRERYDELNASRDDLSRRHETLLNSTSWRLTSFLRKLGALLRGRRS